ncbi:hypothetical protein A4X06_0g5755 [Tilletia controversa]|uniref:Reverse transcriptase Ty1/copia-type domain-containing protein n=1 Tax=Tilletia controversa TaxID=13291 RepID=A0A8X7MR66_9BASI|nr:hypothetical protein A4X06_0g5755 [Tilletia controversa]
MEVAGQDAGRSLEQEGEKEQEEMTKRVQEQEGVRERGPSEEQQQLGIPSTANLEETVEDQTTSEMDDAVQRRKSPRLHGVQPLSAALHTWSKDEYTELVELVGLIQCSECEGNALMATTGAARRTLDGQLLEPATFAEAMSREDGAEWQHSMNDEYKSLVEMKTWELCHSPPGRKLIGCKWVYKVILDPEGRATRRKSRLVAQGFSQVEGIDYDETFAPVARLSALRILLALCPIRTRPARNGRQGGLPQW